MLNNADLEDMREAQGELYPQLFTVVSSIPTPDGIGGQTFPSAPGVTEYPCRIAPKGGDRTLFPPQLYEVADVVMHYPHDQRLSVVAGSRIVSGGNTYDVLYASEIHEWTTSQMALLRRYS